MVMFGMSLGLLNVKAKQTRYYYMPTGVDRTTLSSGLATWCVFPYSGDSKRTPLLAQLRFIGCTPHASSALTDMILGCATDPSLPPLSTLLSLPELWENLMTGVGLDTQQHLVSRAQTAMVSWNEGPLPHHQTQTEVKGGRSDQYTADTPQQNCG